MGQNPEGLSSEIFPHQEDYAFERHYPLATINNLWRLTAPTNHHQANIYHEALIRVNSVADTMFFYHPFYVDKSDGSKRLIFYAQDEMAYVQFVLANWLRANTPYHDDYCYQKGRGVEEAIRDHLRQQPRYAYIFDLRHAYMRVTKAMLSRQMELLFGRNKSDEITAAADFMTVAGRLREGTVTAPFAFNLAVHPFDQAMHILSREKDLVGSSIPTISPLFFTRYADNCAFTSHYPINFYLLHLQVARLVRGHGLELSWTRTFADTPIEYLGAVMYKESVTLDPNKLGLYYDKLLEALSSPTPRSHYKTIVGQFNWLKRITHLQPSPTVNLAKLWDLYQRYFSLCHKSPLGAKKFFSNREQFKFDLGE